MSQPQDDLVEWRKERGLSQTEAAQQLKPPVGQSAWSSWEDGVKPPSLHNAFEIERVTEGRIRAAQWAKPHSSSRRRAKRRAPHKAAS